MKTPTRLLHFLVAVQMLVISMLPAQSPVLPDDDTSRAFEQDKAADVRIDWESDARVFLRHPDKAEFKSEDALFAALAQLKTKHELAVIDMGKPMRMLSDEDFKKRVDAIEARVKKLGFKRVVFHLMSATAHPIYRE